MSRLPRSLLTVRVLLGLVAVVATMGSWSAPAGAHSFLVSTSPFQGQRLDSSPDALVLQFSEAVDLRSVRLDLHAPSGRLVRSLAPELADAGLAVRSSMGMLDDGVYVVAWQALSAVDGHGSSGEFAFSVGEGSETVPSSTESQPIDRAELVSTWLFSLGLAGALGTVVLAAVDGNSPNAGLRRWVAVASLWVSLAGVGLAALAGDGSGVVTLLVTGQLLLVAVVLAGVRAGWRWSGVVTVAAAAVWAMRSHGAADGALGWAVDFVHLAAGAAWLGSLALVVAVGWRRRRRGGEWLAMVQRYARPALWFVVALGAAGTAGAVRLVPSWAELWSTTYGQVVVAKAGLLAVAVVGAVIARWRGLGGRRSTLARGVMTGEATVVVAATLLAGLLSAGAPPLPAAAAEQLLGPPPLGDEVARAAGLAGQLNVELVADGRRLDIAVFRSSGPVVGTDVDVVVETPTGATSDLLPRPCGPGCFTQPLELELGETTIRVTASAPEVAGGTFEGSLSWPPGDLAPERLQQLVERMRQVPQLTLVETVDSGPGSKVSPASFTIDGEGFIDLQPYAAANLEQVWFWPDSDRLQLYAPGSRIFAEMVLDHAGRIATERLVTPGHLINREFDYPD
jgi:copper transport protein